MQPLNMSITDHLEQSHLEPSTLEQFLACQSPSCDEDQAFNACTEQNVFSFNISQNHQTLTHDSRKALDRFCRENATTSSPPLCYQNGSSFQDGNRYKTNIGLNGLRLGPTPKRNEPLVAAPSLSISSNRVQSRKVPSIEAFTQRGDEFTDGVFSISHSSQTIPERPLGPNKPQYQSLTPQQENILEALSNSNVPLATLQISKATGCVTKSDVNAALYALKQVGLVQLISHQPHVWALPQDKGRRTSPGVIGEEKKQRELRRKSSGEVAKVQEALHLSRKPPSKDPRTREWSERTKNVRSGESYLKFCSMCKVPITSEAQATEHFGSVKHRNKLTKYNHPTFCDYCKVNLNSESQANEHFHSARHEQTVAKSQKAPVRANPPLVTVDQNFMPILNTKTSPYGYQIELYTKAMKMDGVCFLPTGTGKTLVSALVIAHMLQLNPNRQVIFLVDRVLLVLQQSDYLKEEVGHLKLPVTQMSGSSSLGASRTFSSERAIRIGAVCGEMRKLDGQARIYEHDILVITADCYRNHLSNGTLRFDDVSLIVLDEAHHCNKDHPYNVIIRDFYLHENSLLAHKPKVLGLTASPAGEPSLERTTKKLQRLLSNLGNALLLTVTERIQELQEKTSQAELVCLSTAYTNSEKDLLENLIEYATKCFNQAVRISELKDYKEIFQPSAGTFLSKEDVYPILRVVDNILQQSMPDGDALKSLLHFQIICEAICTLQECGERVALDELLHLIDRRCSHGFDWAQMRGLPCEKLKSYLDHYLSQGKVLTVVFSHKIHSASKCSTRHFIFRL